MTGTLQWLVIAYLAVVPAIPGYTIGKRRGLKAAWIGFIPLVGLWIVLFRSVGRSAWWLLLLVSLLLLVPFVGQLVVSIWMGLEVPTRHGRSTRWRFLLMVPLINILGYWFYAFTLPKQAPGGNPSTSPTSAAAPAQRTSA
jgi:hypothetical protein